MNILRLTAFPSNDEIKNNPETVINHNLIMTHIIPLSKELIKKGHKVSAYCSGAFRMPSFEVIEGIKIFRTRLFQKPYFLPYGLSLIFDMKKIEKKIGEIDIIHSHNHSYAYAFALFPFMPKKPLVVTIHGSFKFDFIESFILKRLAKKAFFIVINEPSRKIMKSFGVNDERIFFIPTGVDTSQFRPLKKEKKIIFSGRFVWWKNIETIIRAFSLIEKDFPDYKLVLAGSGKEESSLRELTERLGLEKK